MTSFKLTGHMISHKMFPRTLVSVYLLRLLRGVVEVSFGLNRAAATNHGRVMRDHCAIPFPRLVIVYTQIKGRATMLRQMHSIMALAAPIQLEA